MVGLKYNGKKKIPFNYEGENIICGKMYWNKTGDVIQVPMEDAELMVRTSPTDFEIVGGIDEPDDAPIVVLEKEDEPVEEVVEEVMPEVTPEDVVKGPATNPNAKKKGWPKGKKRNITKVEPFFQEHD